MGVEGILNVLTNPTFVSTAQNTKAAVTIETGLKAAGRPAFTLMDKNVDEKTRKYSAAKELIYQTLCLGIYLALIIPVFKKGTFGIFKKIFKNDRDFSLFKNAGEYLNYHELATFGDKGSRMKQKAANLLKKAGKIESKSGGSKDKAAPLRTKAAELEREGASLRKTEVEKLNPELQAELKKPEIDKFVLGKGAIELSSVVGSILGLTILAPELSHLMLHPIMKGIGMEHSKAATTEQAAHMATVLDKKA